MNEGVVVGEPMTAEQRAAWNTAYNRAAAELRVSDYILTGVIAAAGYAIGGYRGTVGGVLIDKALDDINDSALEGLAQTYYDLDGLDGVYDGLVNGQPAPGPLPMYP
jgi:hypothetical protein